MDSVLSTVRKLSHIINFLDLDPKAIHRIMEFQSKMKMNIIASQWSYRANWGNYDCCDIIDLNFPPRCIFLASLMKLAIAEVVNICR